MTGFNYVLPRWCASPEEQVLWVERLIYSHGLESELPFDSVPSFPGYNQFDKSEVPLLAVYLPDRYGLSGLERTFRLMLHELNDAMLGAGWQFSWPDLHSGYRIREICPNGYTPGVRWVKYDANAYSGLYMETVRCFHRRQHSERLAGLEGLQSAVIFPELRASWTDRVKAKVRWDVNPTPVLAGIEIDGTYPTTGRYLEMWDGVPVFERYVKRLSLLTDNRSLALRVPNHNLVTGWHSLPVVRELDSIKR